MARHSVVTWKKAVVLVKPFTATAANIFSLTEMKTDILSEGCYVLDTLHSVVVDLACFGSAAWADMQTSEKLYLNVLFRFFPDFLTITSSNPSSFALLSS